MNFAVHAALFAITSATMLAVGETIEINLVLQRVQIARPYEQVVADIERLIPAFDVERLETLVDSDTNAEQITAVIEEMAGS